MCKTDNKTRQEPDVGVKDHFYDDLYSIPSNDVIMCSQYVVDDDLPNANKHEHRLIADMIDVDIPDEEEDKGKSTIAQLTCDKFLACLITRGTQRMNETMYSVVRNLLNSKACCICGSSIADAFLL